MRILIEAMMELNRNISDGTYESEFDTFYLEMIKSTLIDIYLSRRGKSKQGLNFIFS